MRFLRVSFYTVAAGNCTRRAPRARRIFETRFYFTDDTQLRGRSCVIPALLPWNTCAVAERTDGCILLQLTVLCVTRRVQRELEAIHGFHVRGRGRRGRLRRRGVLPQVQGRHDARRYLQVRG